MVEHTMVEYTAAKYAMAAAEHTTSGYTAAVSEQTAVADVIQIVALDVPPVVAPMGVVSPPIVGILPSRNMHPSSSPGANHMLEIPCPHAQHIDKMWWWSLR